MEIFLPLCQRTCWYCLILKIKNDCIDAIVRKELNGEVVTMSGFLDELERNNTIQTARAIFEETEDERMTLYTIKCGLKVTMEEAKKVFDTEVTEAALV